MFGTILVLRTVLKQLFAWEKRRLQQEAAALKRAAVR